MLTVVSVKCIYAKVHLYLGPQKAIFYQLAIGFECTFCYQRSTDWLVENPQLACCQLLVTGLLLVPQLWANREA